MQLINDSIDFEQYLAVRDTNEKVVTASRFEDAVIDNLYGAGMKEAPHLPWQKTHQFFQMRPSEVTLYAGINGHGKSLVTSQIVLGLLEQKQKACIASFEMTPASTLGRMVKQAVAGDKPTESYIHEFLQWTDNRLWIYDQMGTVDSDRLRAVMRYCSEELHIQHFVIDSLMKVVKGDDDYNGQKNFVDEIVALARETGMHVHLVAHVRKGTSEYDMPDKFSIKGTGSIADQVDNILIVFRHKKKEEQLRNAMLSEEKRKEIMLYPDTWIKVDKQRHFPWEGKIGLWLHHESQSFIESPSQKIFAMRIPKGIVSEDPKIEIPILDIEDDLDVDIKVDLKDDLQVSEVFDERTF